MRHSGLTYVEEVDPRRTLKESGFNLERLFIEELINSVHYLLNQSVSWSSSHVS
jgi:hypothetical protein